LLWNFVRNSGLRKSGHGASTVGECDINRYSGRSGVDSTWRRRQTWQVRSTVDDRLPTIDRTGRPALYIARWFIGREAASRDPSALVDILVVVLG